MNRLFVGNWKMYLSDAAAVELAQAYVEAAASARCDVVAAPGFTALERVSRVFAGSKVGLAAQDLFWEDKGAHTGEVPPAALAALGARYVIVGHSERRAEQGETDAMVASKAKAAALHGLTPIVCVGETLEERDAGRHEAVVRAQLEAALAGLAPASVVIAYEPRWAIGTGRPCAPADVDAMHGLIRAVAPQARVLYGGSVDPKNIASYLALPSVDGTLVGGASTRADDVRAMLAAF